MNLLIFLLTINEYQQIKENHREGLMLHNDETFPFPFISSHSRKLANNDSLFWVLIISFNGFTPHY